MLRVRQLPAFQSVPAVLQAGQTTTVTCNIPLGIRLWRLWLQFGNDGATSPGQGLGTLAAQGMVAEIRLLIGGKVQRRMTACELNALNALMNPVGTTAFSAKTSGTAGAAGYRTYLPIMLAEFFRHGSWLNDKIIEGEAALGAWNLNPNELESCTLEVDLIGRKSDGTIAANLDGPVITGFYEYDELRSNTIGEIVKWTRANYGVNANPAEIDSLPKGKGAYSSLHLFPSSDGKYITSLMFTRNNEQVRQDITRYQNDALLIAAGMNPTALDTASATTISNTGLYNVVMDYDDSLRNFLAVYGANELTLKPTFNAAPAGGMIVISQMVGLPD